MKTIKYEEAEYSPGQKCFGAGYWVLKKITIETIASFPSRGTLNQHLRDMKIELNKEIHSND